MGLISTPGKFTAQPSYAPIDRSGIAGNAKFFFNPASGSADLVNGRVWTPNGSAKIIGTPQGQAFDFNGSGSYLSYTGYPEMSGAIGTLALWFSRVGAASTFGHIYLSDSNGIYFQIDHTGKPYAWATAASASLTGSWFGTINRSLIFVSLNGTAGGLKVYVDGADTGITFSAAPNSFSASSKTLNLGRYTGGSSWDANASLVSTVYLPGAMSAADVKEFHDNKGWNLLQAPAEEIWIAAGGAVPLASNTTATATGAGTLSVAIPITGASIAGVTGQGTLGIALPLAGSGSAAVTGSATLSISQALSGSGTASVAGQGTLGLSIPLNSAALANAIGSGSLNGSIALASNASAGVTGSGNLTLSIALSSAAIANALGSGNLAVSGSLGGAATATVTGSGSLTQAIAIQSASLAATNASGTLTQIIPITSSASVLASGQGSLHITVNLSSSALAQAMAVGNLTLRVALSGASIANAIATGALSGIVRPINPKYSIIGYARIRSITATPRVRSVVGV